MTAYSLSQDPQPTIRVSGPADLIDAVPYLLGFHPSDSLVLLGLDGRRLVVTARLDLADAAVESVLAGTLAAISRGGAPLVVAAVYDDAADPAQWREASLPGALLGMATELGCEVADVLLVGQDRWWSWLCDNPSCCPAEGTPLAGGTSRFRAEATLAGMTALPDRQALAGTLEPSPGRAALTATLTQLRRGELADLYDDAVLQHHLRDELLDAARQLAHPAPLTDTSAIGVLTDEAVARFGMALRCIWIRDEIWMAVDDGRLRSDVLWRELARRLPPPYDAAPLFLLAWQSWRGGNGAMANIAADRALISDPDYSAAPLVLAVVGGGLDPRTTPLLSPVRSAPIQAGPAVENRTARRRRPREQR